MTRAATQAEQFDRAHDHRKNYIEPDQLPDRMNKPLSTAMDIVVLVKAMPNYEHCVALIDSYADMKGALQRLDRSTEDISALILERFEVPNV